MRWFCSAYRPNSIRRVFSGCSSSPNFPSRLPCSAKTVCVRIPLEAEDDVVRIAENDHLASRTLLAPDVHPEIEHSGDRCWQEAARSPTLRSTRLRVRPFPVLHHPGFEPFLDQAQDASVGDAMLDGLDHPRFVEVIEEALDVGIKYVVHLPFHERGDKRIQRALCWLRPRRKPYEKPRKSSS